MESKWSAWNPNSNAVVILCKSHHYRALEGNFYLLQNKRQSSFFQSVTQVSHILLTYVPTYIHTESRQTFRFWTIILKNSFYCFSIDMYHYVALKVLNSRYVGTNNLHFANQSFIFLIILPKKVRQVLRQTAKFGWCSIRRISSI